MHHWLKLFKTGLSLSFSLYALLSVAHAHKSQISIMTFNIEYGGTQIDFDQVVTAIKKSNADVVGIQEAWGNVDRLAKALNWKYYDPLQHIISKFPLFKTINNNAMYTLIEVQSNQFVAMSNLHLPDEPYGPDLINNGQDKTSVIANEEKVRLVEARPVIDQLSDLAKKGIPVFLTGDFNSPSHLDWSKTTVHKKRNHRYVIAWPVTQYVVSKGLIDSYRQIVPDAYKCPGYTWPAKRPVVKNAIDHYNPSAQDLPDRIDFVFSAGPAQVVDSQLVGEKNAENVKITIVPWPSDHRAVVSRFNVTPSNYPQKKMKLTPVKGEYHGKKPLVAVEKNIINVGEPIKISWKNAPGYGYDYISITPIRKNKTGLETNETIHLYTKGQINGLIEYSKKNVQGNYLDWHKIPHASWPLKPGVYEIQLMLDDGYTSLAKTQIKIQDIKGSN